MEFYRAITEAVGINADKVSDRLGIGTRHLYKMMEPCHYGSGKKNWFERMEEFIEACITVDRHPDKKGEMKPFAPLDALERRFNRVAITLPEIDECDEPSELMSKTLPALREAGEFIAVLTKAIENGKIDFGEPEILEKEGWEAVTAIVKAIKVSELNYRANRKRR